MKMLRVELCALSSAACCLSSDVFLLWCPFVLVCRYFFSTGRLPLAATMRGKRRAPVLLAYSSPNARRWRKQEREGWAEQLASLIVSVSMATFDHHF